MNYMKLPRNRFSRGRKGITEGYTIGLKVTMISGIVYSIAMQMAIILVPLYSIKLGLPPLGLAFLISLPAVFQMVIRLFGGMLNNYFGERSILKFSFLCISFAGVIFVAGESMWNLYLAQLLLALSRGLFWSTAQTYLSKLPEVKGRLNKVFGLYEGSVAIGSTLGLIFGGFMNQWFGFTVAFSCIVVIGLINFFLCNMLPELQQRDRQEVFLKGFNSLLEVARHRPLYLAGICAFTAALPLSLIGSFYPVYLDSLGIESGMIGLISSLKSVGLITAGMFIARFLDRLNLVVSYSFSLVLVGSTLILTQMFSTPVPLAAVIVFTGLGSGISSVLYQSLTSKYSTDNNRGSAMAFTTNFWSLSHLVTPVMFGAVTEYMGISYSFLIAGVSILVLGFLGTFSFRWFTAA